MKRRPIVDKRDWPFIVASSALLALCVTSMLFSGCLYIRPSAPAACADGPVALIDTPDEPARHLPDNPSPDLAFKAAAATIRNLEQALSSQQELVRKHNAAMGR